MTKLLKTEVANATGGVWVFKGFGGWNRPRHWAPRVCRTSRRLLSPAPLASYARFPASQTWPLPGRSIRRTLPRYLPMKRNPVRLAFSKKDLELRRLGQVTLRELADRYGVSQTKIWNELCCLGLAGQRPKGYATSRRMEQVVIEGAAEGLSLRQIGRQAGVSHEQVRQIIARRTRTPRAIRFCSRCGTPSSVVTSAGSSWESLCLSCLVIESKCPLNERVRALRLARNWTQQELAEASGVAVSTVCSVESTGHQASRRIILKIACALKVSPPLLDSP
jgi:transcriptional regulator with XRE-family HTH domain